MDNPEVTRFVEKLGASQDSNGSLETELLGGAAINGASDDDPPRPPPARRDGWDDDDEDDDDEGGGDDDGEAILTDEGKKMRERKGQCSPKRRRLLERGRRKEREAKQLRELENSHVVT
jgi:hypothetical protein